MKYLKKVLLATGLIATTLGMSLSANAGAIIQQDIYADVQFSDFNPFNIDLGPQVIGSVTYNTEDADAVGFLSTVDLDLSIGDLALTMADGESADFGLPILAGINPFDPNAGLEFLFETFALFGAMPDYVLTLDVGNFDGFVYVDEYLYDASGNIDGPYLDALGIATLGDVTYVPEPSALVLMLAGLGLLVRRKIAAK
ncbi:PEP-CTERM sorting domain-containing protein [Aliiglaciecola lipolytica]|uniref:PEP-CTERM sorting domain-containing protein n=1 Tax=Aliiglaciecola lipolytica TaxID=477689 RepID=UPI001C092CCF|nr:PEP-CTERM sorting domain-containing protein [Aliiglaciecola lipolytica]MBU2879801.1 PEP-CTERM sorting domain-containing protein [Aliiglaciecola lipolytica]